MAARIERERKAAEQLHGSGSSGKMRRSLSWDTDRGGRGNASDASDDEKDDKDDRDDKEDKDDKDDKDDKGGHRHRHRLHKPKGVSGVVAARIEREMRAAEQLERVVAARIERSIEREKKAVEQSSRASGEPGPSQIEDGDFHPLAVTPLASPPIKKLQHAVRRVVAARIQREKKAAEHLGVLD